MRVIRSRILAIAFVNVRGGGSFKLSGVALSNLDTTAQGCAGRTLTMNICGEYVAEVRSAVLYEKSHSIEKPDYAWLHTDLWIEFPWSVWPPVERSK